MKSFSQLQEDSNALSFDFMILDLKTAGTFLDLARTTQNEETRARNLENAARAYTVVRRLRARIVMTEQQTAELDAEIEALKLRIGALDPSRLQANKDAAE